ncbi:hypothetical protein ABZS66_20280 [Dactylosporangium sp. NPDC005572]|uniref:hypothetical protein n=1 Tax=Dactylosporangium sp. NPDC005572 TaxID=3156889 RepID=UPI00339FA7A0
MIIAGIAPGRFGGVAMIRDDRLLLHTDVRHLDNNPDDVVLDDQDMVPRLLGTRTPDDVDEWAVAADAGGGALRDGGNLEIGGKTRSAVRYERVECLAAAAWCTSPFARRGEGALVAVGAHRFHFGGDGVMRPAGGREAPATANRCLVALGEAVDWATERPADGDGEWWTPPFHAAACAAIGAAALRAATGGKLRPLQWHVQAGPELVRHPHLPAGWLPRPCRPEELARLLAGTGRAVVALHGRVKPARDSLGTRSLLIPVTRTPAEPAAAALCLVEDVAEVFADGRPDPYATRRLTLRQSWAHRLPGLAGGPVRVQTVDPDSDRTLTILLREYRKWSGGVPVLGVAEARLPGRGPFPDVHSALRWDGADTVWADNVLYRRADDKGARR